MKTIWKYPLAVVDDQILELPYKAEILTVQMQHDGPQLWVIVTPELFKEKRHIRIFGTGHNIANDASKEQLKYIATIQMEGGALVFHVFEVLASNETVG